MDKKWIIAMAIALSLSASVCLHAQTDQQEVKTGKQFATKGIIELSGDISLGGVTGGNSYFQFGAGPGINYYVINNFFIGTNVFADVERLTITTTYPFLFFYSRRKIETDWNAGFGLRLGYSFDLSKNIFLNVTPDMSFHWYDAGYFRAYPNITLSLKLIVNNTSINIGFKQNFFYFTDKGQDKISDFYYSYHLSIGFSFFL
jgi:hypothetical protein